jgi:hypothetical protein
MMLFRIHHFTYPISLSSMPLPFGVWRLAL